MFEYFLILLLLLVHKTTHIHSFAPATSLRIIRQFRSFDTQQRYTVFRNSNGSVQNELDVQNSAAEKSVVVVVGGGVGGLACASRIASCKEVHRDTKVILLEKNSNDMIGGRCGSFVRYVDGWGSFRHERGPSLLLLKDVYLDLFSDCNRRAADFGLQFKACAPAYQVVFEDGDRIKLGFPHNALDDSNLEAEYQTSREKMNSFEKDGALKWDEYMQCTEAFLNCGLPNFIEEKLDLGSFPSFLVEALKDGMKSWPLKPHSDVLDVLFESDKMKSLASFQDLYVGLEPYANDREILGGVIKKTAPAVFGLLAAIELHPTNRKSGVFAPIGGFQAVSRAFEKLAIDCGVEVMYNKTVTSISTNGVWYHNEQGQNDFIRADLVICNADLPFAKETLVGTERLLHSQNHLQRYDWDDRYDFSSGVIAFHWSVNKRCDSLETHNVFLIAAEREKAVLSWNAIRYNDPTIPAFEDDEFPFNFYVHRASKTDETAAPDGCDSIMVLVPCCTLQRNKDLAHVGREISISGYKKQFDDSFISKVRSRVLHRLAVVDGLQNLENHIVDEVIDTPAQYANDYNLAAGTPFGLSHGFGQLSITRPDHQSSVLDNLLYVGASSKPGNGVPLVLIGAKQVANKAIHKLKRMQ